MGVPPCSPTLSLLVSTRPLTYDFSVNTTTMAGGIRASNAVATTTPYPVCAPPPEIMHLMPITAGYLFSSVVISKWDRNWFRH